jgi:hypothetical protein
METLYLFLLGVVATASAAIGLFFFRFWRRGRDRLFLVFALAFWLLAVNWTLVAFGPHGPVRAAAESSYQVYILRLLAFGCIIYGIIDKNRAGDRRGGPRGERGSG